MAMMPKRVKFRKQQRGRRAGTSHKGSNLNFGECGLKCLENAWVKGREIEAARVALKRHTRRGGKVWIRIFPDNNSCIRLMGTVLQVISEGWITGRIYLNEPMKKIEEWRSDNG